MKMAYEIEISFISKKNFSFLKIFKNKILKQIAAALCLARDEMINPIINCFLFFLSKPSMQVKLPNIKIKSLIIKGTAKQNRTRYGFKLNINKVSKMK